MPFKTKSTNSKLNYKVRYPDDLSLEFDPIQVILNNIGFDGTVNDLLHPPIPYTDYVNIYTGLDDACYEFINSINGLLVPKIALKIDPDVDGYTSAAMFMSWIVDVCSKLDKQCEIDLVLSTEKKHGYDKQEFEEALGEGWQTKYHWVVFPDAGSDVDTIEALKNMPDRTARALIIDHHPCDVDWTEVPNCYMVNPHNSEKGNKHLTGAGMMWVFINACEYCDDDFAIDDPNLYEHIFKLLALGQVADVSDLRDKEARFNVLRGIEFANQEKPDERYSLIREIINANIYAKNKVSIHTLGWYVAPPINAVIRYGKFEEKEQVLMAMTWVGNDNRYVWYQPRMRKGYPIPAPERKTIQWDAARICRNAKTRQDTAVRKYVKEYSNTDQVDDEDSIAIIARDSVPDKDKPLTGLIANKLTDVFHRPVLLLTEDENEVCHGSGRGYAPSPIESLKETLRETGYMQMIGGHDNAFGVGIATKDLGAVLEAVNAIYKDGEYNAVPVDYTLHAHDLTPEFIESIAQYDEIWGNGVPKPVFAITDVKVMTNDIETAKNGQTIWFDLNGVRFIKKYCAANEYEKLTDTTFQYGLSADTCLRLIVIGTLEVGDDKEPMFKVSHWAKSDLEDFS